MKTLRLTVLSLLLVASFTGCRDARMDAGPKRADPAPALAARAVAPPVRPRNTPRSDTELSTTSASIFLANVEGQIAELERLHRDDPRTVWKLQKLSDLHASHGKYAGDLDEIQLGVDQLSRCVLLEPENGDLLVDRADQAQTLHRFALARADLERARQLGAAAVKVDAAEQELDWNDGRYPRATLAIHEAARRNRTPATLAREAQLQHSLGNAEQSDRAFAAAEDLVRDTSPLPLAWLDVQRGLQKLRTGELELAVAFFREAVSRLPSYVMAREHLAEALHLLGQDAEAIAIYEDVVLHSRDPEFMGALATLYAAHGRPADAAALRARAAARYDQLLVRYPEAMYWHAAEFFLGEGDDKAKALDLLRKNLALRPNSESYTALARAELANGMTAAAKTSIDRALEMPIRSGELFWTAARVYGRLGDGERSAHFEARARAFNRAIDLTEPPIAL